MNHRQLHALHHKHRTAIQQRLADFRALPEREHFHELVFCLLTPASNAHQCWSAVQELKKLRRFTSFSIRGILRRHTRFHNQKTKAVVEAYQKWEYIREQLDTSSRWKLRDWLAANVRGLGLKEASHFLRNIGKSNNELAILDRHILRNLHSLKIIDDNRIRSPKHYREIEQHFLAFSKRVRIPADELDLLFWSKETGEMFK